MSDEGKLLTLTEKLLNSISEKDFKSKGTLVEGQDFHKWYFEQHKNDPQPRAQQNMCQPKVRMLGSEAAVVTYIRLQQAVKDEGLVTLKSEETRVWQIINGAWTCVHFHRS